MKFRHCPFEVKYNLVLLGGGLSVCLLPTINIFERMLPLATPKLVIKSVMGCIPSTTVSPACLRKVVVIILNGLERHILRDKQLPPGVLSHTLASLSQTLHSIWLPKVIQNSKDHFYSRWYHLLIKNSKRHICLCFTSINIQILV